MGPPSLHGKQGQIPDPLCFFRIEQLGKETTRSRATLHWLPPTLKYEGLRKIVNKAVGGGHFEKVPHRVDQAAVYVPREKEKDIPHYVELQYEEQTLFLLVTVPGRRTKCRHCGDTNHWSNRCTRTTPPRQTTYADKTKKAPPPSKAPKPTPTPKPTTKTDNEADDGRGGSDMDRGRPPKKEEEARANPQDLACRGGLLPRDDRGGRQQQKQRQQREQRR